jgi:predicted RNA binding protein YcfA (HicA-like mRNA interferase family)
MRAYFFDFFAGNGVSAEDYEYAVRHNPTVSTRKMVDALTRHYGYQVTPGGKGSHMKLKRPGAPTLTLPGNRSELSPGVVRQVLRDVAQLPFQGLQTFLGGGAALARANPGLRTNGLYDPYILKAVFLGGGPGSGKSYAVNSLFGLDKGLAISTSTQLGLKLVNSDPYFEYYLHEIGVSPKDLAILSPEDYAAVTEGAGSPRGRAKTVKNKFAQLWEQARLGLILDGTGDDYNKIRKQKKHLENLGYDTALVFVNTSLDVALQRNRKRARSLPDELVEDIWQLCQQNLEVYADLFGDNFFVIVNDSPKPIPVALTRGVRAFLEAPVQNPIGQAWVEEQRQARRRNPAGGMAEEVEALLLEYGVPLDTWGQGNAKGLWHLVKEVEEGETALVEEGGQIFRTVSVCNAEVYYTAPNGQTYRLREDRQEFHDGRVRRRDLGGAVSEKFKAGEDPSEAIARGVEEELGLGEDGIAHISALGEEHKQGESMSYPGLPTMYIVYRFDVRLSDSGFNPAGYVEHQDDKSTYFVWEKAR